MKNYYFTSLERDYYLTSEWRNDVWSAAEIFLSQLLEWTLASACNIGWSLDGVLTKKKVFGLVI